jgi:predicted MFS family arabinose efflux permease
VGRSATRAPHRPRTRLWALNLGGFLGPFGGQVVVPMLPEVADALGTTVTAVAWSWSAYTFAMAGLLLVSGTWSARWGGISGGVRRQGVGASGVGPAFRRGRRSG